MNQMQKERIQNLLKEMTVEEKIGQLQQTGPSLVGAFDVPFEELLNMMFDGKISEAEFGRMMSTATEDFHEDEIRAGQMGSFNGIVGAEKVNRLQKIAVEETRLGIPLMFGADVIHGLRTVTPIPLAESCAFDEILWEETAKMSAKEASAAGINLTFAPMVDVARDARWGRISEGAGEDTLLNSLFAKAKVKGYQGNNLSDQESIMACAKHFVAYGAAEGGRDYNTVDLSEQKLREVYLPPFQAAIDAGCTAIMPAFNDVTGVPCTTNSWLLKEVAREELGFEGVYISDANAIAECVDHGNAADRKEAAKKALEAGISVDMSSNSYVKHLKELIEVGSIDIKVLDEAVYYVLKAKMEKGLFENPYQTNAEREANSILTKENRSLARKAAVKSMVLLKNDNLLPLNRKSKIAVAGNLASEKSEMLGAWAISAKGEDCITLVEGMENAGVQVIYESCISDGKLSQEAISKLLLSDSEVIVVAIGERKDMSGEAASRADISLPKLQSDLLKALCGKGKPVVAVLFNGRPIAIPWEAEHVNAILEAWHPGIEAGNAICDILFGDEMPTGKLTTTFPYSSGICPCYYNHPSTGRPGGKGKFTSKYLDTPINPIVYPFGFGLSYTTYEYQNIEAAFEKDNLIASVTLKNTGTRDGEEIVQLYVQDVAGSRVRPVKELKAFQKIKLFEGEVKQIEFTVPIQNLGFYDRKMNYVIEPGIFQIYIGGSSETCLIKELTL